VSYNITQIDIVEGVLQCTPARLKRFADQAEYLPEGFNDAVVRGELLDGCEVRHVPWWGEGSGRSYDDLLTFLRLCDGRAALLICWEGGDSYSGLIVDNGTVTDGKVVQTVVPATQVLTTAASYFALTDRLCAAVGLELEPGEVARWVRIIDGGAKLVTRSGAAWFTPHEPLGPQHHVPALADIPADDPIAALRACVAMEDT
jgi:hypothetical protein